MADGLVETRNERQGTDSDSATIRHNWMRAEAQALYDLPFADLMFRAQCIHRSHFDPNHVETASLLSIKTGGCPEDCGYCAQSAFFATGVKASKLMATQEIIAEARRAKQSGATRFCMGAAWRSPKDRDVDELCATIGAVKALGMETCMTLGMLTAEQACRLKDAGLDYYKTWTPRQSIMVRSLRRGATLIDWRRWRMCAMREWRYAAAASWGSAKAHATAPHCCVSWPTSPSILKVCRSTS
jgi:biotin synthase